MPAAETKPAPERQTVTFDDFSAGDFGAEAAWRAPRNSFTGTNILRYADGSLGPRNGLKALTLSGDAMTGVVKAWGRLLVSATNLIWLVVDATAYVMSITGVVDSCGAIGITPVEPPQGVPKGTKTYLTVLGDSLWVVDHIAGTIAQNTAYSAGPPEVGGRPGLRCIAQYGERTLAGGAVPDSGTAGKAPDGTTAPGNRLYFSAASDPTKWPAANYIDIGDTSLDICAITPQRTHCMIATTDGSWWILTGVPGVNPVLRQALQGVSPAYPHHVAPLGNGNLAYYIGSSTDNGSQAALGEFTGSQVRLYDKIPFGSGRRTTPYPTATVMPLKNADDWFCQSGHGADNTMALRQLGAWTKHQWQVSGVTLSGLALTNLPGIGQEFFTDGGAASTTPKIYQWRSYNTRPAFTADSFMQPGDASTTPFTASFTTPEWFDPQGREVSVEAVTVDFTSWDTGSGSTNHYDLNVISTRVYNAGSSTSSTVNFDQASGSSAATTAGTRQRKRHDFSNLIEGNGFQLVFSALRGVAIQKIQVHLRIDPPRF